MHLCNGTEVSDGAEDLVDLKEEGRGTHVRHVLGNLSKTRRLTGRMYLRIRKLEKILISQIDQERIDA